MSLTVQHLSLSSLKPLQMSYNLQNANEEVLTKDFVRYEQGLTCYNYNVLENTRDVVVSKNNLIVLTDIKDLANVFEKPLTTVENTLISGNCYLSIPNPTSALKEDVKLCYIDENLYAGGKGKEAVFTIFPVASNNVRIKIEDKFLRISSSYPYELFLTEIMDYNELSSYTFTVTILNNKIALQSNTSEGKRFLACSKQDRKFRAVGLQLNSSVINQYLFNVEFITTQLQTYGFDPRINEIKYYNNLEESEQATVAIKDRLQADTNLLLTLPTAHLFSEKASVNISILKTNFSEVGTFNSSI